MNSYERFRKELASHDERQQAAQAEATRLKNEGAALRAAEGEAIVSGDDEAAAAIRKKIMANEAALEQRQTEVSALSKPVEALRQIMSKGKIGRLAETVLEENARQIEKLQKQYDERATRLKAPKTEFLAEVEAAGNIIAESKALTREMEDAKRFTAQANRIYSGVRTDIVEHGLAKQTGVIYLTPREVQQKFYGRGL